MEPPRYPFGTPIRAGDQIMFQGRRARVLFVKQTNDFAPGVAASDWDFMPEDTIFLEFEDGQSMGYDSFCDHDEVELLPSTGAA